MSDLLQVIVSGLANGCVYTLIALGFALIYKATGVLNFAQGELMMVGAYICFTCTSILHLGFLPAVILMLLFSLLFGAVLEVVFLRSMIGKPVFSVVMITVGMASLIRSVIGVIFNAVEKPFVSPFSGKTFKIAGVTIWQTHFYAIVISLLLFVLFLIFFRYSRLGIAMRSAAEDQDTSRLMGISINKVFALTWAIASAVSAIAGIIYADLTLIYPSMSLAALKVLPVIVLAGLDSVEGVVLGGIIIGLVESVSGAYLGNAAYELSPWILLMLTLMIKPYGFFGSQEIKRV